MISIKSFKNFIFTNSILMSLSTLQYYALVTLYHKGTIVSLISSFGVFLSRNYLLMFLIDYGVRNKRKITNHLPIVEAYTNEFHINVASTTLIEACTYKMITTCFFHEIIPISIYDIIYFIPWSFIFEIILDFFHYWTHRIVHGSTVLYSLTHKKHHKYPHPITILTYYQDTFDILFTNTLPLFITMCIMWRTSLFQFNLMLLFKEYIEISGHCGRELFPSSSFSQFIWLPKVLGIQLHTEDHDLHHLMIRVNYGKRFSLWDRLFGTFLSYNRLERLESKKN
jgi:sterol desaturase/sphingolipid hydroxylase (fatty acid hydroxylase superfamily)